MTEKGASQIDFVIAISIFIAIFAFLIFFNNNYFVSLRNDASITERQNVIISLLGDLCSAGEPTDWDMRLYHFSVNKAANWSRSVDRSSNATIKTYLAALNQSGDGNYAVINKTENSDALEMTFPSLGLPQSAKIGSVLFKILYNATAFKSSKGEGDWKDDFSYLYEGDENFLEDWGVEIDNQWIWWNSSNQAKKINTPEKANNLMARVYYQKSATDKAFFDAVNMTVNYSYYPYYPAKLGLSAETYYFEVLLNNTLGQLANEKVIVNFSSLGYNDADMNSVVVYNESGSMVPCNISGKILSFTISINNETQKWYKVWFSRNSTSNFSQANCNSPASGTDQLTTANKNETLLPVEKAMALSFSKLFALNSSMYETMKGTIDVNYDFHITINDASGSLVLDYGGTVPARGDVNALQRDILYQNSTAGLGNGKLYVYVW